MTKCIIEAIELDPDNQDYKNFLREIYNKEWKPRKFHGEDGYSKSMIELKDKVQTILMEGKALK